MEIAMLSQLFYTRTVQSKPSGELKSNVAYCQRVIIEIRLFPVKVAVRQGGLEEEV